MGYWLASPIRRWMQNPEEAVAPYIREGMTVLEPGPGMGFFTLPMAGLVGPSGRVVAVDIQQQMLDGLRKRATRAGLLPRIDLRLAKPESLGIEDLKGAVDFVLAFAMVHETPSAERFFYQVGEALKPGGTLLLAEPAGHVSAAEFETELRLARGARFTVASVPAMRRKMTAVLRMT